MKLFVWDFHGVLEIGNELAVTETTNKILGQSGYDVVLSPEDGVKLYGKKWYEYFEFLIPNESLETHRQLQLLCIEEFSYENARRYIRPTPSAHRVLDAIQSKHDQIVISNTQPDSLDKFLDIVEMLDYFPTGKRFAVNRHIDSNAEITKAKVLKNFLVGKDYEDLIIVGDSPGDVELKSVAGGTTYLFAHPHLKHRQATADKKISNLSELLKEV